MLRMIVRHEREALRMLFLVRAPKFWTYAASKIREKKFDSICSNLLFEKIYFEMNY
jgi:hypothetical protein